MGKNGTVTYKQADDDESTLANAWSHHRCLLFNPDSNLYTKQYDPTNRVDMAKLIQQVEEFCLSRVRLVDPDCKHTRRCFHCYVCKACQVSAFSSSNCETVKV